jgi:hypothetical protein
VPLIDITATETWALALKQKLAAKRKQTKEGSFLVITGLLTAKDSVFNSFLLHAAKPFKPVLIKFAMAL